MHYAIPLSCLRLLLQDAPQDVATCQGTLAVELAALLSADMPPHLAKLVQRWLQQTLSAFPWLRWHTPLSQQLSEAWETGEHGPHGAKQHSAPAAAVLRQVVKHQAYAGFRALGCHQMSARDQCPAQPGTHIIVESFSVRMLLLRISSSSAGHAVA